MGAIDSYVLTLSRALHGPRRAKGLLLREARDHLADAATAYEADGLSRAEAEARAVEEFGAVNEIAPEYQAELGLTQTRRTALLLFTVLVAQTVIWGPARRSVLGGPEVLSGLPALLNALIGWLGLCAMVAAVGAIVSLRFANARLTRWAGAGALTLSVVMALIGVALTLLGGDLLAFTGLPWTVAFGLLPMLLTAISARRCLRAVA